MAPHNDAPSPTGSYTDGFNRFALRGPPSGFASGTSTPSPLSSSPDDSADGLVAVASVASAASATSDASDASDAPAAASAASICGARPLRRLGPGVYVPTPCFFSPDAAETVDTATLAHHAVQLARAGVAGLAVQGSNGEAVHLTTAERQLVTRTTRDALDAAGFTDLPVIAGCGAQSTRETIAHCTAAWAAGADAALVLPPSYYSIAPSAMFAFFEAVADASPLPLLLYNYPAAANGFDLSSDGIIHLAAHPNIVGVKLTCGNTGKLARVVAGTRHLKKGDAAPPFLVLGGSADFTLPALVAGGHGILAGLANLAPKTCVRTIALYRAGRLADAQALQETLAVADWTAMQGGVLAIKGGLEAWRGYGGFGRSPLPRPIPGQIQALKEVFRELALLEKSL